MKGLVVDSWRFALFVATGIIGYAHLLVDDHDAWANSYALVVGVCGVGAAVLLGIGWAFRLGEVERVGLLAAVGVWVARGALALTGHGALNTPGNRYLTAALSFAWAIGAAGDFLTSHQPRRVGGGE